jgi:putative Mg2+ transporter-C (MgtC) family protein
MDWTVIALRIVLASILGGFIGLEREMHGCAAGLRTHILVSIGSALFMLTSLGVGTQNINTTQVDPSRIAAGVVTGIGFLGAGAIIRYGTSIRGLTTAASIWAVSAIGLSVGTGMYAASLITTFVAIAILVLSRLEERMELKRHGKKLYVTLLNEGGTDLSDVENVLDAFGGRIKNITSKSFEDEDRQEYRLDLMLSRIYSKDIVSELSSLPGVKDVRWR